MISALPLELASRGGFESVSKLGPQCNEVSTESR